MANRIIAATFAALFLATIGQALWQHAHLPETVAAHFNATGIADGWMPRTTHTAWHVGLILFLATFMECIARLNVRLPDEYINIPHRDHWLASERRAATHAWLASLIRFIGCVIMAFLLGLSHQAFLANIRKMPMSPASTGLLLAGLFVSIVGAIIASFLRFRRPPA